MCKEQSILIKKTEEWTECPASRKRLLKKKYRRFILSSFQKTKSTQTSESVSAQRIKQAKDTKNELEQIRIVECFLHFYGGYSSNLVIFEIKSL